MVVESALNRYRVRPLALTRMDPRLLLATRTVAVVVVVVVVVVVDGAGGGAAVAAAPPPQAATARAMSGITAALARKVMGLLRVMLCSSGLGRETVAATSGSRITQHIVLRRKTS
jgi:ribosomal protein S12 methylthiotransferase accessory factor YcaO